MDERTNACLRITKDQLYLLPVLSMIKSSSIDRRCMPREGVALRARIFPHNAANINGSEVGFVWCSIGPMRWHALFRAYFQAVSRTHTCSTCADRHFQPPHAHDWGLFRVLLAKARVKH